jgi:hypothetical protein
VVHVAVFCPEYQTHFVSQQKQLVVNLSEAIFLSRKAKSCAFLAPMPVSTVVKQHI